MSFALRAPDGSDAGFLRQLATNAQVRRYLGGALTPEQAEHRVNRWLNATEQRYWLVFYQLEPAGLITLGQHIDTARPELSFQFMPSFQGVNLAFQSCTVVLQEQVGSVVAETQLNNLPAQALLGRLGFIKQKELVRFGERQGYFVREVSNDVANRG